jgi:hypothetical protein
MMIFCYRHFAPKRRAYRTFAWKRAAFAASLSGIAALTACGGGPKAANVAPTTPGGTSTANLSVASNLPAGTQGAAYNGSITASGGTAPYNYAVTSGQMPGGVSLDNSTGNVAGTPTASGNFSFGVSVTDASGASEQQPLQIAVAQAAAAPPPAPPSPPPSSPSPPSSPPPSSPTPSGSTSSGTLSNLQNGGGWGQYGQGPPNFVDCSPSPCDGIAFSMTQGSNSPSLSGNATIFNVGGTTPYSDALFNNHLIGVDSSQGMPDPNQSQLQTLYNFQYDVDFYGDNLEMSQALEFDINQFFSNMGFIFGHECRIASGNEWDIWDNSKGQWIPTGIPCYPNSGQWNHVTLKVQRTSDNHETYQSITLNGQTTELNWTFEKGASPGWYGLTLNFQMDGNYKQDSYNVSLDNLTLTYQ